MLVGQLGGAGPAGIDDHQPPAPGPEGLEPAGPVRRGGQAPVGIERVRAEHDEQVGAVDVGDGHGQRRAEQESGGDLLGPLVDGAGGEDVAGAERLDDRLQVELAGEVVDVGIAEIDAERLAAVGADDAAEQPSRLGEGLVPADLDETAVAPYQRGPQPVRVLVEVLEGRALGTQVPGTPHVVAIAPDADDLVTGGQPDLEPAGRLAQRADPQCGPGDRRCHQSAAVTPDVMATGACVPLRR